MSCRPAKSLLQLRDQIDRHAPKRSTASDGYCASQQHHQQNPTSDHDANSAGVATAGDFTHDPKDGADMAVITEILRLGRDSRLKYCIHERRIFASYPTSSRPAWTWGPYTGDNPHTTHAHVSVSGERRLYDSTRPWAVHGEKRRSPRRGWPHRWRGEPLRIGDSGRRVKTVKRRLNRLYPHLDVDPGLPYGQRTADAVSRFQERHGLDVDGTVGPETWRALWA